MSELGRVAGAPTTNAAGATGGGRVIVVDPVGATRQVLGDALAADVWPSVETWRGDGWRDAVLVVDERALPPGPIPAEAAGRTVILVEDRWHDAKCALLRERGARLIVVKSALHDVAATVGKLLSGEIFGPVAYVAGEALSLALTSSREKERAISECRRFARELGLTAWTVDKASVVVDELVTNAIYNAPIDLAETESKRPYAGLPRTTTVELPPAAAVKVTFRCDGARFAIAVEDAYGSLEPATVTTYLAKCFAKDAKTQVDTKPGGAGLGLYTVFESAAHLVVNVDPQSRTEVIAIFDVGTRAPVKSLTVFAR